MPEYGIPAPEVLPTTNAYVVPDKDCLLMSFRRVDQKRCYPKTTSIAEKTIKSNKNSNRKIQKLVYPTKLMGKMREYATPVLPTKNVRHLSIVSDEKHRQSRYLDGSHSSQFCSSKTLPELFMFHF
jgi:hypothetical protein